MIRPLKAGVAFDRTTVQRTAKTACRGDLKWLHNCDVLQSDCWVVGLQKNCMLRGVAPFIAAIQQGLMDCGGLSRNVHTAPTETLQRETLGGMSARRQLLVKRR